MCVLLMAMSQGWGMWRHAVELPPGRLLKLVKASALCCELLDSFVVVYRHLRPHKGVFLAVSLYLCTVCMRYLVVRSLAQSMLPFTLIAGHLHGFPQYLLTRNVAVVGKQRFQLPADVIMLVAKPLVYGVQVHFLDGVAIIFLVTA